MSSKQESAGNFIELAEEVTIRTAEQFMEGHAEEVTTRTAEQFIEGLAEEVTIRTAEQFKEGLAEEVTKGAKNSFTKVIVSVFCSKSHETQRRRDEDKQTKLDERKKRQEQEGEEIRKHKLRKQETEDERKKILDKLESDRNSSRRDFDATIECSKQTHQMEQNMFKGLAGVTAKLYNDMGYFDGPQGYDKNQSGDMLAIEPGSETTNNNTVPDLPIDDKGVSRFLTAVGLTDFISAFAAERIDMDTLMMLTDKDLVSMKLPLGPRKKLLQAIQDRNKDM